MGAQLTPVPATTLGAAPVSTFLLYARIISRGTPVVLVVHHAGGLQDCGADPDADLDCVISLEAAADVMRDVPPLLQSCNAILQCCMLTRFFAIRVE